MQSRKLFSETEEPSCFAEGAWVQIEQNSSFVMFPFTSNAALPSGFDAMALYQLAYLRAKSAQRPSLLELAEFRSHN